MIIKGADINNKSAIIPARSMTQALEGIRNYLQTNNKTTAILNIQCEDLQGRSILSEKIKYQFGFKADYVPETQKLNIQNAIKKTEFSYNRHFK